MPATQSSESLAGQILALANERKLGEVENLWVEAVQNPPTEADFYAQFVSAYSKAKSLDRAHGLLIVLMDELCKRQEWRLINRIVQAVAVNWPTSPELRGFAEKGLRGQFSDRADLDSMLARTKLADGAPVDQALKRFKLYLRLSPGQAYQHATWGEGVVRELDLQEGKVIIDFTREKGKSLTFEGVKKFLTYLPPSGFLAQRIKEPEKLAQMAEDDPVALIKLALEGANGKIKQSDLKVLLINGVISAARWNSWWGKARHGLRLDPLIDFDSKGGAHAEISLRSKPKSFEEEIEDIFFASDTTLNDRIDAIQTLAGAQKKVKPQPDLLKRMLKRVEEDYRVAGEITPAHKLQFAFLRQDIIKMGEGLDDGKTSIPRAEDALDKIDDYATLKELDNVDYSVRALHKLIERDGAAGLDKAIELLPHATVKLAQAIWREMDQESHIDMAVQAMETLFSQPLENPDTYFWAVRAVIDGGWNHLEDHFPLTRMVPEVLDGIEEWQDEAERSKDKDRAAAAKSLATKARTLLQAKHFAAVCSCAEQMTLDQAQRFRKSILGHKALNEQYKSAAHRQLLLTRKDLEGPAPAVAPADADFHYCTGRLRQEKMKELQHLNGVEIPANSREIEEARQEGDLKENAGYHAAKDKQKMLMQKTLQLQQGLAAARVFEAGMVKTDSIGFGVRFTAENQKSGKPETYVLLGRWEADAEKQILSYLAPMMQQFVDKKVGESVTIKHPGGGETPYKVVSIENALAGGDWDAKEE